MTTSEGDPLVRLYESALAEIRKVIVAQDDMLEQVLAGLFAGGHILIEGAPGTAKTLLVRTLGRIFDCRFKRVQFTPDLMPTDIIGTNVFDPRDQTFDFRPGPIFGEFILGDEINRAPPKTQAAMLEAMQERQVTVDGTTHPLPPVFTVFATQNPVEQEGTYPLPEAQLDRFMLKVFAGYPTEEQEVDILRIHQRPGGEENRADDLDRFNLQKVGGEAELLAAQDSIRGRTVRDELLGYLAKILRATRESLKVEVGASPRAGVMLLMATKAHAAVKGRPFAIPDDVKAMAPPVLRHRIILKPGAEIDGYTTDGVIEEILARTEIPR